MIEKWAIRRKRQLMDRLGFSLSEVAEIIAAEKRVRDQIATAIGVPGRQLDLFCVVPEEPGGAPQFVLAETIHDGDLDGIPGLLVPVDMQF